MNSARQYGIALSCIIACAGGPAWAQQPAITTGSALQDSQDPPPPQNQEADADQDAAGPAGEEQEAKPAGVRQYRSLEAVFEAKALFEAVRKAYREAPAIRDDDVKFIMRQRMRGQEMSTESKMSVIVTPDSARVELTGQVEMTGQTYTAVDGTLYAEREEWPEAYYAQDLEGGLTPAVFQEQIPLVGVPYFAFVYGEDPLNQLSMYTIEPSIAGLAKGTNDEGKEVLAILIDSQQMGAPIELHIDPETKLITRFETVIRDPSMDPDDGLFTIVELHPEIVEELPLETFFVETEDRKELDDLYHLLTGPTATDLIGEDVPGFSTDLVGGETMQLDDWLGHVIVVIFWRATTEDLFPALDPLHQVAQWTQAEGLPVKFLCMAVWDEKEALELYWEEHSYTLPLGMDKDAKIAQDLYRVPYLPVTVIIAPDGKVHQVRVGINPDEALEDQLKNDIQAALKAEI